MRKKMIGAVSAALLAFPCAGWADPLTIAAFGDSLTQGYGLPADQGFVPQLQRWLNDQGADAVLVNAGVSGDTSAGGAARVGWTLTPEVGAMIVELGANDMLRGIDPAVTRANLDQILTAADDAGVEVLLVGMEAAGNWGPDYKEAFDAIYPDLAAVHDVPLVPGFFDGIAAEVPDFAEAQGRYFQADGLHPNAQGVTLVVQDIGPAVLDLIDAAREAGR
ncbi:arylesterase [Chachezhania sediminis]|uniref:arylesterase n=1 Tax=Chachezhania sediminis TaxID=2599291 RepID=UPI001E47504A|nr:arylesterase [Chachezhania sediminis]